MNAIKCTEFLLPLDRVWLMGDPKIVAGYGEPGRAEGPAHVEGASNEGGS